MKNFAIFVILPIVLIFTPLVFGGKIFFGGDLTHYSYPAMEFFQTHYLSGLNPYLYLGFPLASSFQYSHFNPVYLLVFRLFDFIDGYHLILFLNVILGAVFAYLFFTSLSLSRNSSLIATVVFSLSQIGFSWIPSSTISNGFFLLPAILWSINQIILNKKWSPVFLVVVFGYAFLSVHYQFIVMAFCGGFAFLTYQILFLSHTGLSLYQRLKLMIWYFIALAGGFIIGAPQILNTYRFFEYTTRSSFITYEYLKWFDPAKYLLPSLNVQGFTGPEFMPYIGIVPLFLVIIALVFTLKKNSLTLMAGLGFLLFFSLVIEYSPTALILKYLPVFKYFAIPARWLYVGNIFLAILTGFGWRFLADQKDEALFRTINVWIKRITTAIVSLLLIINLFFYLFRTKIIFLTKNYFDTYIYPDTSQLPLDYYHQLIVVLIDKAFYNISLLNPHVILLLVTVVLLWITLKTYHNNKEYLFRALVILTIINLVATFFFSVKFTDRSLVTTKPQFVTLIKQRESDLNNFRVYSYLVASAQYREIAALHPEAIEDVDVFALEGLIGNTNDLALVGGVEGNGDRKVQQLVLFYLDKEETSLAEKIPLLSALNVKYIVTPYEIKHKNLVLVSSILATKFKVPLYLYENKEVMPRIFFPKIVSYLKENDDQVNLNTIVNPSNNFTEKSYIECNTCDKVLLVDQSDTQLFVVDFQDEKIKINTQTKASRWLVVSNADVLGWKAYIDGKPVKIYPANYALQGIYVPAGEHVVELVYRTKWWEL
ncbi:MAG: YfhO family protein [Candidatus Vogelbacteria bacterium]|nr:YfhO family protein [Candidatus Vogelbacteria bacterium]